MTAAERLKQLSGLAGASAAVMLLAIGTGATAGEILASKSGLASATAAEHLLAEREQADTASGDVFDAPYQAYVKRINAERMVHGAVSDVVRVKNDVAILETRDYDSRVGRVAPRKTPILHDVAPVLNDVVHGINLTQSALHDITKTALNQSRIDRDDEAAIVAMFMLMIDD